MIIHKMQYKSMNQNEDTDLNLLTWKVVLMLSEVSRQTTREWLDFVCKYLHRDKTESMCASHVFLTLFFYNYVLLA